MPSLDEGVSRLIGAIYGNLSNGDDHSRLLDEIRSRTKSRYVQVSAIDLHDTQYSKLVTHGADDACFLDGMQEYSAELFSEDPTIALARASPKHGYISLRESYDRLGRNPESDRFQSFYRGKLGAGNFVVRYVEVAPELSFGVSIHTGKERASHSREELQLFKELFFHLANAALLSARPLQPDNDENPIVVLNRRGMVLHANDAASELLRLDDGLRYYRGRIRACAKGVSSILDRLIADTARDFDFSGTGGAIRVPRPSGEREFLLRVTPLPVSLPFLRNVEAAVLVRIERFDTRLPAAAVGLSKSAFGLTEAEARLVDTYLATRCDLQGACAKLGISYGTGRVHMRSIFEKTGVSNQPSLVRILSKLGENA